MGIDTDLFMEKPHGRFICAVCLGVHDKPTTACANGHTYCEECLFRVRQVPNAACPTCRGPFLPRVGLNRPLQNLILALPVRCGKKDTRDESHIWSVRRKNAADCEGYHRTCGWEGPLADLHVHRSTHCDFAKSTCPNDCREELLRGDLRSGRHEEICPLRRVTCLDCNYTYPLKCKAMHLMMVCPFVFVPCKYCKQEVRQKELRRHYGECSKYPVGCSFAGLGCKDVLSTEGVPTLKGQV